MSWLEYYTTSDGDDPVLGFWRMWSTALLPVLPGPLSLELVVPIMVLYLGHVDLYKYLFQSAGAVEYTNCFSAEG